MALIIVPVLWNHQSADEGRGGVEAGSGWMEGGGWGGDLIKIWICSYESASVITVHLKQ